MIYRLKHLLDYLRLEHDQTDSKCITHCLLRKGSVRWIVSLLLAVVGFAPGLLLTSHQSSAQSTSSKILESKIHHFDAGHDGTAPGHQALAIDDVYSEEKGYGWTTPPDHSFSRASLNRFREGLLLDGVAGKTLAFRADVPAGLWWISLWMEAGLEDTNTAQLTLNGRKTPLAWNPFNPPAEPRKNIQKLYRHFHKLVEVGNEGLRFELAGQADSVRVLGFTLYPDPAEDADFLEKLRDAGSYTTMLYNPLHHKGSVFETLTAATNELQAIRNELDEGYWHDRLNELIRAERLLAMRGWDWANDETGLSLFERIHQGIMILDGILDRPDAASFPLYERALFSRGRLLHWLQVEGSEPEEIAHVRQPDFARLYELHSENTLLAMYNGNQIDVPDDCDNLSAPASAPEWAILEREALCRLRNIAHWWVNEQQAPNGEFGGKYGDDVEILRWWPALILSGDTTALAGWKRLADGVWHSGKIKDGYAKNVSDVEHASEFVSDTAPVMAMFTDDPVYTDRLRPSARHFENLWTGITPAGHRIFKSAWFSSSEIDMEPPKNRDTGYNTRAAKAVRYLAWKTGERDVIDPLVEWAKAWVAASKRTDKSKPHGLLPASIQYPDETFNGDGDNWYDANMYWSYFNWQNHAGGMMLDQLFFTYTLTGDEVFLEPLIAALELIDTHRNELQKRSNPTPGSPLWAAQTMLNKSRFWSVVSQWRLYTGDTRFDEILIDYGTPYLRYRLAGDESLLIAGLQEILDKVRYNPPLLTYEAIHTDRIYVTNSGSGSSHLKAMLTGDGMIEDMSPYPAVTWSGTGNGFTALVTDASSAHLEVQIYSFADEDMKIEARLWGLEPGLYSVSGADTKEFKISRRGESIVIGVPSKRILGIRISRLDGLD